MKLRTLLITSLTAGALLLPAAAHAAFTTEITDDPGDAPKTIDIIKVKTKRTDTAYQARMKFTDLKRTRATRRYVTFESSTGMRGSLYRAQTVEFRISPGGRVSTKNWHQSGTGAAEKVSCPGVRASANFTTDKVVLVIPEACWFVTTTPSVYTSGYARKYNVRSAWDGATLPADARAADPVAVDETAKYSWQPDPL